MSVADLARFLGTTLVLCLLAVMIASVLSPPDPYTVLLYAVPLVAVTPVIAYFLTYRDGFDTLGTSR